MSCSSCGSKSLIREDISGNLICASCGTVQKFDNYDSQIHGRDGPTGTYVHVGTSVKWFLTTGRRPMPVVAAVLVFVAEINGVGLKIEDVAKEVNCVLSTCRRRYSELLEALVKVSQALPWGKDVNVKNIVKNAPFVMGYMEMKSMEKRKGEKEGLECAGIDLGDVVSECLKKDIECEIDEYGQESDVQNVNVNDRSGVAITGVGNGGEIKLSHECLRMIYTKFVNEVDSGRFSGESGEVHGRKLSRGFDLSECGEWWNGKSEFSKKLMLEKILEKDVGLDTMPPSFVKGNMVSKKRRAKINSAKARINKIMHPSTAVAGDTANACLSISVDGKKRKRKGVGEIDWEDFIIETLLLHQVKEEEIEKGYYKTLLDLHVFNSGVM
ncbi:Transcription factor TFIIB [Melia azedarach]|uniref:Transcription factor TFIIB n=1 Tax=Melia azedarach TaxID=155640 RepID=A0ACC1WWZ6_MELAZ|nr:Transcription factor TFIIB [Melia azedarach]